MENNHPKIDETSFLYEIVVEESAIDQSCDFEPIASKTLNFGLLNSKYFEAVTISYNKNEYITVKLPYLIPIFRCLNLSFTRITVNLASESNVSIVKSN